MVVAYGFIDEIVPPLVFEKTDRLTCGSKLNFQRRCSAILWSSQITIVYPLTIE